MHLCHGQHPLVNMPEVESGTSYVFRGRYISGNSTETLVGGRFRDTYTTRDTSDDTDTG